MTRVLVLRALGLGDLLTAVPALRGVRAAHPRAQVVLAGPARLAGLLPAGLVDDVVDTAPLAPLDASLAGADLAVNLHGRGPQSTELLRRTDPGRLVAFGMTSVWRADEHEVHRWCRLVTEAGMPADPAALELDPPTTAPPVAGAVVVHPGAALPSRRWPPERWATVARALADAGGHVVLTGSPAEAALAADVARQAELPPDRVLAGRTTAVDLAALVATARLLVSVDTGVAHLATGLGTPSVVLFGPTSPALWGPPAGRPRHRMLWAGRTGDNDAPATDPGLLAITAAQVVTAAVEALALERQGRRAPVT